MNKKVILDLLKKYGLMLVTYFKDKLLDKVKEAFNASKKEFLDRLWDSIKDDLKADLNSTVEVINEFLNSSSYKEKEEAVISTLMANVKLPLFLKPFRGLIKNALKSKIRKLVEKALKKIDKVV